MESALPKLAPPVQAVSPTINARGPKKKRLKRSALPPHYFLMTVFATRAQEQEPVFATSFKDIVRAWHTVVTPAPRKHFLEFKEGGLYKIAHTVGELKLDRVPGHVGEVWFQGTQLFINRTEYTDCIGVIGRYEIALLVNGNLRFVEVDDVCKERNHFRGEEYEAL